MIDNKELIKPLLNFEDENDFYMLYVFKRKKDQIDKDNHQSVRTIKTYCINSVEYLEKRWDEITHLCEYFKARAYIHIQKQNHKDVSLNLMELLCNRIRNGVHNQTHIFDSVVGQIKTNEKRWIVDIDNKDEEYDKKIQRLINTIRPEGNKIIANIPTKNGHHLIVKPFDVQEFTNYMKIQGDVPEIQKKNPTLIYFPNSLNEV